jgi:hypothetical protein
MGNGPGSASVQPEKVRAEALAAVEYVAASDTAPAPNVQWERLLSTRDPLAFVRE